MIEITVKSMKYNCSLVLRQKITVIRGHSGRGKTVFYKSLEDKSGAFKIHVSSNNYKLMPINENNWFPLVDYGIEKEIRNIYVIDDEDFITKKDFARLFKEDKYSYFIIINRFESFSISSLNMLPFAVSEIYKFVAKDKEHSIEPFYDLKKIPIDSAVTNCVIEDSSSGFTFFKEVCSKLEVDSTYGKDKVLAYIKNNKEKLSGTTTLLLVDMAAFGSWFDSIKEYVSANNLSIVTLMSYNSFEYLLLRSNMFRFDFSILTNDDIASEMSLERLSEKLLVNESKDKFYHYDKKELNKCYLEVCCYRNQNSSGSVEEHCDKGLKGDKIVALLSNTEFSNLLALHE